MERNTCLNTQGYLFLMVSHHKLKRINLVYLMESITLRKSISYEKLLELLEHFPFQVHHYFCTESLTRVDH